MKRLFADSEETPKQQQPMKCLTFTDTRFYHERRLNTFFFFTLHHDMLGLYS